MILIEPPANSRNLALYFVHAKFLIMYNLFLPIVTNNFFNTRVGASKFLAMRYLGAEVIEACPIIMPVEPNLKAWLEPPTNIHLLLHTTSYYCSRQQQVLLHI